MRPPPNTHANPLSGLSEDYADEDLDTWEDHPDDPEEDVSAALWQQDLGARL